MSQIIVESLIMRTVVILKIIPVSLYDFTVITMYVDSANYNITIKKKT